MPSTWFGRVGFGRYAVNAAYSRVSVAMHGLQLSQK